MKNDGGNKLRGRRMQGVLTLMILMQVIDLEWEKRWINGDNGEIKKIENRALPIP